MAVWIPWAGVLACGDYLSPVEIPWLSARGSARAYLATLRRLAPLVEQAEHVVPGHGAGARRHAGGGHPAARTPPTWRRCWSAARTRRCRSPGAGRRSGAIHAENVARVA